jgi:hypothetical protein
MILSFFSILQAFALLVAFVSAKPVEVKEDVVEVNNNGKKNEKRGISSGLGYGGYASSGLGYDGLNSGFGYNGLWWMAL